jgi:hypothetical protein
MLYVEKWPVSTGVHAEHCHRRRMNCAEYPAQFCIGKAGETAVTVWAQLYTPMISVLSWYFLNPDERCRTRNDFCELPLVNNTIQLFFSLFPGGEGQYVSTCQIPAGVPRRIVAYGVYSRMQHLRFYL